MTGIIMNEPFIRSSVAGAFSFFLFLLSHTTAAQTNNFQYGAETAAYAGNEKTLPFWLYSNTHGIVDQSSSNFISRLYGTYTRRDTARSLQFTAGFDMYSRLSDNNTIFFNQLFGRFDYRGFSAAAGRFYDPIGLNDRGLSMGSMLVGRNAPPIPKVRIGTKGFMNIPRTSGHLQFKAMLSHGWFEEDRHVKSPYLHQKTFYLKYKTERFDITAGAAHNVIWGGTHPAQPRAGVNDPYKLPSGFSDFLDVFFGQAASGNNAPESEITNTIGNSVAAYEVKAGVNFTHFRLKAYRQFYLEDKVALRLRSPWDGLWGVGFERDDLNGIVTEVLWEHLNTKRQNAWKGTSLGRTNYYNNGVYRTGWTYKGNIIGTPLLVNGPTAPFDGGDYPISNNIIIAHHVGIKGRPADRLSYHAFFTYSRNYGTGVDQGEGPPYIPLDELRADQFSALFELQHNVLPDYGLSISSSLAYDVGDLYGNNRLGLQFGVRWKGIVN